MLQTISYDFYHFLILSKVAARCCHCRDLLLKSLVQYYGCNTNDFIMIPHPIFWAGLFFVGTLLRRYVVGYIGVSVSVLPSGAWSMFSCLIFLFLYSCVTTDTKITITSLFYHPHMLMYPPSMSFLLYPYSRLYVISIFIFAVSLPIAGPHISTCHNSPPPLPLSSTHSQSRLCVCSYRVVMLSLSSAITFYCFIFVPTLFRFSLWRPRYDAASGAITWLFFRCGIP